MKDVLKRFAEHIGAPTTKCNDSVEIEKNEEKVPPNTPYREVVGPLLCLANGSCPGISYAVSRVAVPHVYHIGKLAGTQTSYGIQYTPQTVRSSQQNVELPACYFSSKMSYV